MSISVRAPLWGALLLYFVLTAALIARVPWGASPDEAAHTQYIEAIASTGALPVFRGQVPPAPGYEFHQPPLFYLLAAPLWSVLPAGVQNYAMRALSLGFGLATIAVVWQAANLLFGRASRASALCVVGAALSPLHQGVGAGVNNDALAGLWSACLFFLVARAWIEGPTKRLILWAGVVAGLGALTKLTAFPLGLWAFAALYAAIKHDALATLAEDAPSPHAPRFDGSAERSPVLNPPRSGRGGEFAGRSPILALLPSLGVALLLASPMLARNQLLYGDPFAYGLFSRAATLGTPGFPQFGPLGMPFLVYARGMAWQILLSAWGFFGGASAVGQLTGPLNASGPRFPDPLWLLPLCLVVLVPLGGVWSAWKGRQAPSSELRAVSNWWIVGALLLVLLWANFAYAHFSGGQARYFHGALLPLILLVGGGLARSKAGTLAAWVLGLTMLGLTLSNIFAWQTLDRVFGT